MPADRTPVTAGEAPGGVRLTIHARDGQAVVETTLPPRQALRLGLDLVQLASAPAFRLLPPDPPAGTDAGLHEEN